MTKSGNSSLVFECEDDRTSAVSVSSSKRKQASVSKWEPETLETVDDSFYSLHGLAVISQNNPLVDLPLPYCCCLSDR